MLKKIFLSLVFLTVLSMIYYQVWFLRQPERQIPYGDAHFISPANGKISAVTYWEGDSLAWLKDAAVVQVLTEDIADKGWLIAIEMDITNVHYQRAPIESKLIKEDYTEGKFRNALVKTNAFGFRLENERNALLFKTNEGLKYKVVQIAGLVARRIEDYLEPNQKVAQGEVIGLIKLGSQVVLILPDQVKPLVKPGDIVTDGETILAEIDN